MLDKNVARFCELVLEINELNKKLEKEKADFYYGGHEFEDVYSLDVKELADLQTEFKKLIKILIIS